MPTPTLTPVPLVAVNDQDFGPVTGTLFRSFVQFFPTRSADVLLSHFVADVTFVNPFTPSLFEQWDYGFIFHRQGDNFDYVTFRSSEQWSLYSRINNNDVLIDYGLVPLNTTKSQTNHIIATVVENTLQLIVNDRLEVISTYESDNKVGNVEIGAGFIEGSVPLGTGVQFVEFKVRSLGDPVLIANNTVPRQESLEAIGENYRQSWIAPSRIGTGRDFIVEATFDNPTGTSVEPWSYGFVLRDDEIANYDIIIVRSDGHWYHISRGESDGYDYVVLDEFSPGIDTRYGSNNTLRVTVVGDTGWLTVNDVIVGQFYPTELHEETSMWVTAAYFKEDAHINNPINYRDLDYRSAYDFDPTIAVISTPTPTLTPTPTPTPTSTPTPTPQPGAPQPGAPQMLSAQQLTYQTDIDQRRLNKELLGEVTVVEIEWNESVDPISLQAMDFILETGSDGRFATAVYGGGMVEGKRITRGPHIIELVFDFDSSVFPYTKMGTFDPYLWNVFLIGSISDEGGEATVSQSPADSLTVLRVN